MGVPLNSGSGISTSGSTITNAITSTLWYKSDENALSRHRTLKGRVFMELQGNPNEVTQDTGALGI
jgi:hypothetical protein